MARKDTQIKKNTKLSDEDITDLAKVFELLIKMDEQNIREGKYTRGATDNAEVREEILNVRIN